MESTLPTCGQLERELSQKIQALYRHQLGHKPSKILCHLFANHVVIIAEDTVTPVEKLLTQTNQDELVLKVRSEIKNTLKPQLQELIEEVLKVSVVALMSDTVLEKDCTGFLIFLTESPHVRNSSTLTKSKKYQKSEEHQTS